MKEPIDITKVTWIKWWNAAHFDEASGISVTDWIRVPDGDRKEPERYRRYYFLFPVQKDLKEGEGSKYMAWCRCEETEAGKVLRMANNDFIRDMLSDKAHMIEHGWHLREGDFEGVKKQWDDLTK